MSKLEQLLTIWKNDENISENIVKWRVEQSYTPSTLPFPENLHPVLKNALEKNGCYQLYSHQKVSFDYIEQGKNIVVVTGTASGKTLCYNMPILHNILSNIDIVNALYIFPTKALSADQQESLEHLLSNVNNSQEEMESGQKREQLHAYIYDGDTPQQSRSQIRKRARLILTNPDMLHMAMLPYHTNWEKFFRNLKFIVVDEIHIYRGVFGSHVTNVIRRLKRICDFYKSKPQFIMTSATISNPRELAELLSGENVTLIDQDGSPKVKKHFLLYNPPIIKKELGIRLGASTEAVRITSDLLSYNIQTIIFARARRSVEMIIKYLKSHDGNESHDIRGYRSGYLPSERREIEKNLRKGKTEVVVATNALELGVDIGSMQSAVLIGYPGSIAATRQQAGRAGRRSFEDSSLAVLIATSRPIDQFLMKHPDYIFERPPERALIDPNNLLILLSHLKCACYELPFSDNEIYGKIDVHLLKSLLKILEQSGILHFDKHRYHWIGNQYPSADVSLRNAGEGNVLLQCKRKEELNTVGRVDKDSAVWMAHPGAIYLHDGRSYRVNMLDLDTNQALMDEIEPDYYTEPKFKIEIEKLVPRFQIKEPGVMKYLGDIQLHSTVVGFRRIRWDSHEVLGDEPLVMPPVYLDTCAFWLVLDEDTIDNLRKRGLWNNEKNYYGVDWKKQRDLARARDDYKCRICGVREADNSHHVHHKIPFRQFTNHIQANHLDNLITLCPLCHERAEIVVKMKSGLSGLRYVFHQFAPLFIMCDANDLGSFSDMQLTGKVDRPFIVIYEQVPAGIGLCQAIYDLYDEIIRNAYHLVKRCECTDGCPSCVGPAGENGVGGKQETFALLSILSNEGI